MKTIVKASVAILLLIVIVVAGFVGRSIISMLSNASNKEKGDRVIEETVKDMTKKINSKLPIMVDSETRLDKTESDGKNIHYKYTMVNLLEVDIEKDRFHKLMTKAFINNQCSNENIIKTLKMGVKYYASYFDKNGILIATIKTDNESCGFSSSVESNEEKDLSEFRTFKEEYIEQAKDMNGHVREFNKYLIAFEKRWGIFYQHMTNEQIDAYRVYKKYKNDESLSKLLKLLDPKQQASFATLKDLSKSMKNVNSFYLTQRKIVIEHKSIVDEYAKLIIKSYSTGSKIVQEAEEWLMKPIDYPLIKYYVLDTEADYFLREHGGKGLEMFPNT